MTSSIHSAEIKDLIITNMLRHVPVDGWTQVALIKALKDTGFHEEDSHRAFMGSMDCAIEHYLKMIDRQMEEQLASIDLSTMRVRDRVATGVMIRLRIIEEHKEAVRQSLWYLAGPIRSRLALKSLYHTVDTIWYAAGDQVTDFNYYTKRFLLAGVYTSTLLYWLKDNSMESSATRAFLERRLDDVMMAPKFKQKLKKCFT